MLVVDGNGLPLGFHLDSTSDKDLLKQTTLQTLRRFKFRGQIVRPAEAVAYLSTLTAIVNVSPDPKR